MAIDHWARQAGYLQIELVTLLQDGPHHFPRRSSRRPKPAASHVDHTHDFDADPARYRNTGAEVPSSGLMKGATVCWIDITSTLGFMTELITANPLKEQVFARFREAAANWDGVDPIRRLS